MTKHLAYSIHSMMNPKGLSSIFFAHALLMTLLLASCQNEDNSIRPEKKAITESVYASGIVVSRNQYEVFGKVNGIIEDIYFQAGNPIKKGDILMKIKNENASLATDNARLTSQFSDILSNAEKLYEAENAVNLAEKRLSIDSLLRFRQENLWAQGIGSEIELKQKVLNHENAKLSLISAKTKRDDLRKQLNFQSKQSKNNLKISELLEDDFLIRSEMDGVVYQVNRQIGEPTAGPGPLAVIGANEFIIELNIDEYDIVKIKPGLAVIIRMDSYQNQVFKATISSIDPMMDMRTRTFKAEAAFVENPVQLYPNLTAEASIVIRQKSDALTIPRSYLLGDTAVMLQDGSMKAVQTGLMDYALVEIVSGIDAETRIVLPEP